MSKKQLLILGGVLAVGLLVLSLGVFYLLPKYREYQQSYLNPPDQHITVLLSTLSGDYDGTVGVPIQLVAQAFGDVPLESFTFWINNIPVKLVDVVEEDTNVAEAFHVWVPLQEGQFTLFARAQGGDSQSADSDPIEILISPGQQSASPEPLRPDPDYSGPLPGGSGDSGEAQNWSGSLGGWISPASAETLPDPPGLSAVVDGCAVTLKFSDNSDNETGFRVYRHLPNIPGWSLADVLAANDSFEALLYTDSGYHGLLSYKVAAFNNQGEALSNPVSVEVAPEDCPSSDLPIMKLQMVELLPKTPVDQAYCYFSLGGEHWLRWPQQGYLPAGESGFVLPSEGILSFLEEQLEEGDAVPELLLMDCWGWLGGELVDLGKFQVDGVGPASPGPFKFSNDFLEGLLGFGETTTMEGEYEGFPLGAFLPMPVLSHSDSVYDCLDKKGNGGNIPFDYCLEADGETPWPFMPSYITWEITNNCQMSPGCLDLIHPELSGIPELANAEIGYRVYFLDYASMVRSFNNPSHMVYMVPGVMGPVQCRNPLSLNFQVKTYLIPQGSQEMYESAGYWFGVPEPCPAVNGGIIKLTPEMLFVGSPDEEPNEGSMLDLYGVVIVYTGNMKELRILQFGEGGDQINPGCPAPDSTDEAGGANYGGECPITNGWGVDLAQAYICPDAGFNGCNSSFSPNSNQVELSILEGEGITVWITVMDHDVNSADDEVCSGSTVLPPWVLDGWQNTVTSDDLMVQAFGDYGACLLQFSVEELLQFTN